MATAIRGAVPVALLLAFLPTLRPAPLRAQAEAQPVVEERSPLLAGVLQAAFPPLPVGYVYVGEFARGLVPTALMVGGTMILFSEGVRLMDWTRDDKSPVLFHLGLVALAGGYAFGIWDVVALARRRNARAAGSAGVSVLLLPAGDRLTVGVRVDLR